MNDIQILTPGVIQARNPTWFRMLLAWLFRHVFIGGGTGKGKTKLLELLMRQLATHGIGFSLFTPHPDAREAFLQWAALNGIPAQRIVDVKPSPECCMSIDPFAHPPIGATPIAYEAWLRATAGRVRSAFLRNVPIAEQEVMNRLKRWLGNVLYCCGKEVDGEHLGIDKALILLDPSHPEFDRIMDRLDPHLSDASRADFRKLKETKGARQQEQWVESTINRLREVLDSPLVRQMFGQKAQAIDDEDLILSSKIQLVSVPESDYLTRDQGNVIAGLRISAMIAAAKRIADHIAEDKRVPHVLIIDEAENFVGEDIRTGFQELRKFRMPIIFTVQDLSCLRKGDMDLVNKVLSQCGLQMTFQQQDPESIEYLAKAFGYAFLDMTPLLTKQVLPAGYAVIQTQGVSFSSTEGMSVSKAQSITQTQSFTHQQHTGESIQNSVSRALSETESEGTSSSSTTGTARGLSHGTNWSKGKSRSRQFTQSESESESEQLTESHSHAESATDTASVNRSLSEQTSSSHSDTLSENHSLGHADSSSSATGKSAVIGGEHVTASQSTGNGHANSQTNGTGRASSSSMSTSQGISESEGSSSSRGQTETTGQSLSQGRSFTRGSSVSDGRTVSKTHGGSETLSRQDSVGFTQGKNSSRGKGVTHTKGLSAGSSRGKSYGRSNGQSFGNTNGIGASQTNGMTVSFNQTPLAIQEIEIGPSGKLVTQVPDQLYKVMKVIASLGDRMVFVKCMGMDFPFILRVHEVVDPYVQKKMVRSAAWRADDLKRMVASIRAAHPYYFLPSLDEEPVSRPCVTQPSRNGKLKNGHGRVLAAIADDDPMR